MRLYLHTFGCKANQSDTERVRQAFEELGAEVVADPATAELAVVNTCTVTHVAEAKMRGLVRGLARRNPRLETILIGCAAALDDGTLARLPSVRAVVAGGDVPATLGAAGLEAAPVDPLLRRFDRGARAWLKVQDGCDEHCTFCATTLARGASRSRAPQEVLAEARALALHHAELVVTGVHIGSYGADLGEGWTLSRLVAALHSEVPGTRIRLSSLEATEVDDALLDLFRTAGRELAPHLHAPLQSGSDRLLKRMGRHWYTAERYARRVERLAASVPVLGLGADVLVGFPGETAADHRATVDLVRRLPFTYLHVFPYSERPGVAASRLGRPVPPEVRRERAAELRELAQGAREAHRAARRGQGADGVFAGRRRGRVEFLTEDYLTVTIDAAAWDGRWRRPVVVG